MTSRRKLYSSRGILSCVADKEFNLSYHTPETTLFAIHTCFCNSLKFLNSNQDVPPVKFSHFAASPKYVVPAAAKDCRSHLIRPRRTDGQEYVTALPRVAGVQDSLDCYTCMYMRCLKQGHRYNHRCRSLIWRSNA